MNTSAHPHVGLDFCLRALGFADRAPLHVVARDNRYFSYRDVVCKPDFVILDKSTLELWVLDLKTRTPVGGMTAYEAYQVLIYGLAVRPQMERELCRPLGVRTGVLYTNDQRLEVVPDEGDIAHINGSIEPARDTFIRRGEANGRRISGTQLARYMADPSLTTLFPDDGRRERGIAAHAVISDLARIC